MLLLGVSGLFLAHSATAWGQTAAPTKVPQAPRAGRGVPTPAIAAPAPAAPTPPVTAPSAVAPSTIAPSEMTAPPSAAVPVAPGGLSLDQAVQLTLARNEQAKVADLNVVVADAAVEKAFTAFLPVLTATGGDTQTVTVAPKAPYNVGTAALTVNQPLLNASAFPLYSQAKNLADGQRASMVDQKRLLAFGAANAFFAVLNSQDLVDAAQRQLENAKANLDNTQARAQSQLSSTNDVTKAKVDLMNAQHELETDKGNRDNAFIQLGLVINSAVPASLSPPAPTLAAAQKAPGAADTLAQFALDHRQDVVSLKYAAAAAHDFADEPLLRTIPTVGLQAQANGTTHPAGVPWDNGSAGITLTWTIYDAGVRYADKHSRDAQADIAELNLRYLARSVDAQVRGALAQLLAAQAAFHAAEEGVKVARLNVEETAILYRQGLGTALELVDANDSRFTAEVNYASAEFAMAQAYLGLRQALGLDPLGTELR
jgi:outer membrane protein TolC